MQWMPIPVREVSCVIFIVSESYVHDKVNAPFKCLSGLCSMLSVYSATLESGMCRWS